MPLAAVFIVLLSIALMFIYGVPAVRARLADYGRTVTVEQAVTAAETLSETRSRQGFRRQLELSAETAGGELMVVDQQGKIVAREGSTDGFEASGDMLQAAS